MKIAIFSDIQGHAFALDAILNDMQQYQPDLYICCGDIVTGVAPNRCIELLQSVNCRVVRGNMDVSVLNPASSTGDDEEERKYNEIDLWCYQQLSDENKAYLADLPTDLLFDTPFGRLLCVHGSPQSDTDVIDGKTPDTELYRMLLDVDADFLAVGHMHMPMLRYFDDMIIFNPGSAGLPYGGKRPMPCRAHYVILEDGVIHFHTVLYDAAAFHQSLLNSNMPHREWFASKWLLE